MGRDTLRGFALGSLMILFTAALATQASAANCGDTSAIDGTNVNCSCGDTVTTNTNLNNSDPVTQAPCTATEVNITGDGLFVSAGVRLTINNKTLQGSGIGSGVTLRGDNARVISGTGNTNSTIQGFAIGVRVDVDPITNQPFKNIQILSLNVIDNSNEGIKIAGNLTQFRLTRSSSMVSTVAARSTFLETGIPSRATASAMDCWVATTAMASSW